MVDVRQLEKTAQLHTSTPTGFLIYFFPAKVEIPNASEPRERPREIDNSDFESEFQGRFQLAK